MSGEPLSAAGPLFSVAGPAGGAPAPLTQEQVEALIAGRTPPEVASLLESHPGFVRVDTTVEAAGARPAPLTPQQVEHMVAGTLGGDDVADILQGGSLPTIEGMIPAGEAKRAPVELSAEELAEAARGATPEAVLARLPDEVGGEILSLPDLPLSRPSESPPDLASPPGTR